MISTSDKLADDLTRRLSELLERSLPDQRTVEHLIGMIQQVVRTAVRRAPDPREGITPPMLARQWGISPDKVLAWIRSGELRAVNVATDQSSRPRYVILPEAITEFTAKRSTAKTPRTSRKARRTPSDVIQFF